MMPEFRSTICALVLAVILAPVAAAEPESCALARGGTLAGEDLAAAQLQCDIDRAAEIAAISERVHGPRRDAALQIVDTAAPSGAAYIYDVYSEAGKMLLEARSVPVSGAGRRAPACRLTAVLPEPVVETLNATTVWAGLESLPPYGSRESVTMNADGSRNVKLLFDSHDIITVIATGGSPRRFSRHAGSTDAISELNGLVIGVANVSSNWTCKQS